MTNKSFVNPKDVHPVMGYTHVVSVDGPARLLFISGQVSKNKEDELVGKGDLDAQTRQVYLNLGTVLKSMGASFADVVKQNIYTTRPDQVQTIRRVRTEFLSKAEPPASTLVGVTGLVDPEFLIEIEMVAVLKQGS
jgi:enamine deaminase RidA (YjgF/YER057c/UK114 family)